jgi:hypothetical protein
MTFFGRYWLSNRRCGRLLACLVRHWIVSASRVAGFEKTLESVNALGAKFGFDPAKAVVSGRAVSAMSR